MESPATAAAYTPPLRIERQWLRPDTSMGESMSVS